MSMPNKNEILYIYIYQIIKFTYKQKFKIQYYLQMKCNRERRCHVSEIYYDIIIIVMIRHEMKNV